MNGATVVVDGGSYYFYSLNLFNFKAKRSVLTPLYKLKSSGIFD